MVRIPPLSIRPGALWLLLLATSQWACDGGPPEGAGVAETDVVELDEGFTRFYERFHADSAYQVAHVTFPLEGNVLTNAAGERRDVGWAAEDWVLHRPLALGDRYVREVETTQPDLVTERVRTAEGQYIIERRFARLGTEWYLIYYRVADVG